MHRKVSYDLSKMGNCWDHEGRPIGSIVIRTTDGDDETYASKRAESKGSDNWALELVRISLVRYTLADSNATIEVKQPFEAFDKWSSRSRAFVTNAWRRMASVNEAELVDFFGNATDVE